MNALIATVINNKTILIANEGRLLKKFLVAFLIFTLAFQSGQLGEIVRNSLIDAYLQVSVFVGFTLFLFLGLDSLTKYNIKNILEKSKKFHVIIASLLGSLPGCGGAIIVVTQYIQGRLSFGALVAVLTATMGDAAFLLLSQKPYEGAQIFLIACLTGILSGYIIDLFYKRKFIFSQKRLKIKFESIKSTWVSKFNKIWVIIFIPGFLLGLISALQIEVNSLFNFDSNIKLTELVGSVGVFLSIFMWALNPLSDFQCSTEKSRSFISRVVDTTNFVTTWVVLGFLFFELIIFFSNIDLLFFFDIWKPLIPLIAILFGFIPGCGPQIVVTSFYLNGYIPFSAEIGNAISNDGDALFPAIALAPRDAILATIFSAIPAVIVAYTYMFVYEM
tara:strand:- start:5589 stop:6755 length:1167 start_codon:yes stop_codon:yes gene_type:complete